MQDVRFCEVLIALLTGNQVFWVVYVVWDGKLLPILQRTEVSSTFGVKRPTERNIPEDSNLHQECYKPQIPLVNAALTAVLEVLTASCLMSLPVHKRVLTTEDGGSYLLRKVGKYLPDDTV